MAILIVHCCHVDQSQIVTWIVSFSGDADVLRYYNETEAIIFINALQAQYHCTSGEFFKLPRYFCKGRIEKTIVSNEINQLLDVLKRYHFCSTIFFSSNRRCHLYENIGKTRIYMVGQRIRHGLFCSKHTNQLLIVPLFEFVKKLKF